MLDLADGLARLGALVAKHGHPSAYISLTVDVTRHDGAEAPVIRFNACAQASKCLVAYQAESIDAALEDLDRQLSGRPAAAPPSPDDLREVRVPEAPPSGHRGDEEVVF